MQKTNKCSFMFIALFSLIIILAACSEIAPPSESSSGNENNKSIEEVSNQKEQLVTEEIDFKVDDIWMLPAEAGEDAEVYMSLNNQGNEQVDLHDAMISGVSYQVSFYKGSENYDGGYIEVPAGEIVHLAPDELHMIFESIDQKMNEGDTFDISLHLTPYGDVNFQGVVENR